jgi:hypothetical protein
MGQATTASIIDTHVTLCEMLGVSGIILDVTGRVRATTHQADRMIDAGDLIRLWQGQLQLVSPSAQMAFREALEEVTGAALSGIAQSVRHGVVFDADGQGYLSKLSLVQGLGSDEADDPILLITLRPLQATAGGEPPAPQGAIMMRSFALSPDEAHVARGLTLGESLRQIAEDLCVPIEVVRREMTSVCFKIAGGERARLADKLRGARV